jgi:DNA-directed RNA polymerase specialized sigma54-like protein
LPHLHWARLYRDVSGAAMSDKIQTKPFSIPEAAQELGLSQSQVKRLIDSKQLEAFNGGCSLKARWRIQAGEITRFIEARTNTSGS